MRDPYLLADRGLHDVQSAVVLFVHRCQDTVCLDKLGLGTQ